MPPFGSIANQPSPPEQINLFAFVCFVLFVFFIFVFVSVLVCFSFMLLLYNTLLGYFIVCLSLFVIVSFNFIYKE